MALAIASGALWFSALVAVLLFRSLDDPALAGRLAADVFVSSYLAAGTLAALGTVFQRGRRRLAAGLMAVTALQLFWIVPALRHHGEGWPGSFATLHGTASLLHLLLALGTLVWSWKMSAPDGGRRRFGY